MTKEMMRSSSHTKKDLWETPDYIFDPLNDFFKFTLDPACTIETAKAQRFYTPLENGLLQSWEDEVVFVNPPYSRGNIDQWMKKCLIESIHAEIIALIPVSTSSKWFHAYVLNKCEIKFVKGRIKFKGASYTAPFSSMICHYRK